MKLLRVAGVRVGTATSGRRLVLVAGGLKVGIFAGVVGVGAVVLSGETTFIGVAVFGRVDLAGGVTVIAGAAIPIARLATHNPAITLGLILLSFMISASRSIILVTIASYSIDYTLPWIFRSQRSSRSERQSSSTQF